MLNILSKVFKRLIKVIYVCIFIGILLSIFNAINTNIPFDKWWLGIILWGMVIFATIVIHYIFYGIINPIKLFNENYIKNTDNKIENDFKEKMTVSADFIDLFIKKDIEYSVEELAEQRFNISYSIMVLLSLFSIGFGYYIGKFDNSMFQTGLVFFTLSVVFTKYRMPLLLSLTALSMLLLKILSFTQIKNYSLLSLIILLLILLALIQSFRSSKYLQKNKIHTDTNKGN